MLMAPMHARLRGLHRVPLVVDGRRRAREIEDLVDLDEERVGDVVAQELEALVVEEVLDVASGAGEEIVDAEHLVAALEQPVGEVRPEEACSAGNQNSSFKVHCATLWSRQT